MQLHVWDRRFLLRAPSLVLPAQAKPYKRLSMTLLFARARPFAVGGIGPAGRRYRGLLLTAGVPRASLDAAGADLAILDAGITTLAYWQLRATTATSLRVLDAGEVDRVQSVFANAGAAGDCAAAGQLYDQLVAAVGNAAAQPPGYDPRVQQVIQLIEELPLDELSVPSLARAAALSESRLRSLFQQSMGCPPMTYIRWAKTWQAIRGWRKGMSFTEAAHQAGFYDLAHVDHSLKELFGMNPSALATASGVQFHHCGL